MVVQQQPTQPSFKTNAVHKQKGLNMHSADTKVPLGASPSPPPAPGEFLPGEATTNGWFAFLEAANAAIEGFQTIVYGGLGDTVEQLSALATNYSTYWQQQIANNTAAMQGASSTMVQQDAAIGQWMSSEASQANQATSGSSSALQSINQSILSGIQQMTSAITSSSIALWLKIAASV